MINKLEKITIKHCCECPFFDDITTGVFCNKIGEYLKISRVDIIKNPIPIYCPMRESYLLYEFGDIK